MVTVVEGSPGFTAFVKFVSFFFRAFNSLCEGSVVITCYSGPSVVVWELVARCGEVRGPSVISERSSEGLLRLYMK